MRRKAHRRGGSTLINRKTTTLQPDASVEDAVDTLAEALRRRYEDVKNEKVPDHLQRLIDALKEVERTSKQDD